MLAMFSDLPAFRRDALKFFLDKGESSESLVKLRLGPDPVFLVNAPGLAWQVLKSPEEVIDKGRLIFKLREVIGTNSLTLSGEAHRTRRKAIHGHLTSVLSDSLVAEISSTIRESVSAIVLENRPIAIPALTARLSMRVICDLLFGRGTLTRADENAVVGAIALVEDDLADGLFRLFPYTPWAASARQRKLREARETLGLVVERARKKIDGRGLFGTLEGLGLEGEALRDEALLVIIAGHHTAGSAAAWLLYHIATDPTLANALVDEASRCAGATDLTVSALKDANLSRACSLEALRLYPSAHWMSREVQRGTELDGVRLSKGTSLIVSPWMFHRSPKHWLNPGQFDTTRTHTGEAFIPFGVGPRACIGARIGLLELQLIALEFASAFSMRVTSAVPALPPKSSVTLVPSDIAIQFTLRSQETDAHLRAA
jgi:cytochrome P450